MNQPPPMPTVADLAHCQRTLAALCAAGALDHADRGLAAVVQEAARLLRQCKKARAGEARRRDEELLDATGIRTLPAEAAAVPLPDALLSRARTCYICKRPYERLHAFYDCLCPGCGDFNLAKRQQTADLRGRVAVLTGGRVKIGFQIGLRLLRAGARLIVTTRFPHDAARRYAEQPDADACQDSAPEIEHCQLRHGPLRSENVSSAGVSEILSRHSPGRTARGAAPC